MARLFGLSGLATGKKGDNVFVVRNGCQIIRQYVPHIKDPKTPAQIAVRAKTKLMTQLSVVYAPIVAMPKVKMTSPRMRFIRRNYPLCHYEDGKADVLVQYLQLTMGFRYVPHFNVDRSSHRETLCWLQEDARSFLSAVVYAVVAIDGNNRLYLSESAFVTEAGENGTFPAALAYESDAIAVYCYGIYNLDDYSGIVSYGNIGGNAAAYIADLVALRSPRLKNAYLSQTKGCFLDVGVDIQSSREESGIVVNVVAPSGWYTEGAGRYAVGDEVVVYCECPVGWAFDGYYVNGILVCSDDAYVFTASENVTVECRGHQISQFTVNVYPNDARFGSVSGGGSYQSGQICSLVATPAAGYAFKGWYDVWTGIEETSHRVSADNPYSFQVFDGCSLIGVFEAAPVPQYSLSATFGQSSEGVAIAVYGQGTFAAGSQVELECEFDDNSYEFVGWFNNEWDSDPADAVSLNPIYSFVLSDNTTLYYVLKEISSDAVVSVVQKVSGWGSATGTGTYPIGSVCTLFGSPGSGGVFSGWEINGKCVGRSRYYSFVVTGDVTVTMVAHPSSQRYVGFPIIGDPDAVVTGFGLYPFSGNAVVSVTPSEGHSLAGFVLQNSAVSPCANGVQNTNANWSSVDAALIKSPSSAPDCCLGVSKLTVGSYASFPGVTFPVVLTKNSPYSLSYVMMGGYEVGSVRIIDAENFTPTIIPATNPLSITVPDNAYLCLEGISPE